MKLDLREVKNTDVSYIEEFYPSYYNLFKMDEASSNQRGEHYKLVKYLSDKFSDQTLLDLGTREGISALCMAPTKNKVVTYDILPIHLPFLNKYTNVEFKQLDINLETKENLLQSPLMLLDVDPHDGKQETVFLKTLRDIKYKGLVVLDDIRLNPHMIQMWESIPETKYDLTAWGHFSGTGLVDFSGELEVLHYGK
tara:strand:+ start:365 stop:952 length:588 start_codon:yes stop_codon:yes gene_type:complete